MGLPTLTREVRRIRRAACIAAFALATSGCAGIALTAGGIAGGAATDYTLSGIAYKTFTAPMQDVRRASLDSLARMGIRVDTDKPAEKGWQIAGRATDRTINIGLERITSKATRMRVVVDQGNLFFKDSATGTEIILQTADRLDARARNETAERN